jgi:hypothetical protein
MRPRWESPADDPDPPECDIDEECEGGDDCTRVSDDPKGCECACHKTPEEPDYEQAGTSQEVHDGPYHYPGHAV